MEKLLTEFLNCQNFAVIGSFRSPEKFAYKIVQFLLKKGKTVFPINPTAKEVLGLPCCPDIALLPIKPDVVNLVTQPEVSEKIVQDCLAMGIDRVWAQPGAESVDVICLCNANGIKLIYNTCILMQ